MRFEEAHAGCHAGRMMQQEAVLLLGVCERSFRRYVERYEAGGLDAPMDKRISQLSHRRAPVDEVTGLVDLYCSRYAGWNVRHFHSWYVREHAGTRSYSWGEGSRLLCPPSQVDPARRVEPA